MSEATTTKTYCIPEVKVPQLECRIAKLARRAEKLGVSPIRMAKGERYLKEITATSGKRLATWVVPIEVSGERPVLDGWSFLATLQHEATGNVIRMTGEGAVPVEYRTKDAWCDHCQVSRARRDTYVVRNEAGEHRQVGRSCLRDFLGHPNPQAVAALAELWIDVIDELQGLEDDEPSEGCARERWLLDLEEYLTACATEIRTSGWVSRRQAEEALRLSTADAAMDRMWKPDPDLPATSEEDGVLARAALAWARELADEDVLRSEYLWNLKTIAGLEYIEPRSCGIAASMLTAHARAVGRERESGLKAAAESEHFGEVGKRQEFELRCLGHSAIPGIYGTKVLHRLADADGNRAVWFQSSGEPLEVGGTYKVRATVKAHDHYRGAAQTVLSRVAVAA